MVAEAFIKAVSIVCSIVFSALIVAVLFSFSVWIGHKTNEFFGWLFAFVTFTAMLFLMILAKYYIEGTL